MFSCEYRGIFKKTFFYRKPLVAASATSDWVLNTPLLVYIWRLCDFHQTFQSSFFTEHLWQGWRLRFYSEEADKIVKSIGHYGNGPNISYFVLVSFILHSLNIILNTTGQKMKVSIEVFFSKCDQILNVKLHFLCSASRILSIECEINWIFKKSISTNLHNFRKILVMVVRLSRSSPTPLPKVFLFLFMYMWIDWLLVCALHFALIQSLTSFRSVCRT